MAGKVYLVGAGPGDPELLTLKGLRVLREAEVVVYDRLANPELLAHARPDAERIYVGKQAQRHAMTQEEINALLVHHAQAGKVVCRLKGGDPFVFGRGGEEAEVLVAAGVPWEYVPGISSAIAVPGYAGIPVTHREHGSTFAVITAHEDPAKEGSSLHWEHLAQGVDTLIFLMGMDRLPQLTQRLLEHGRSPETPAAVISWGTHPQQRTVDGTLANLAERCAAAGIQAPAVTVVGNVASLRASFRWFETRPLFGRRIVITRPRHQADEMAGMVMSAGGIPVLCPAIQIVETANADLSALSEPYDWVVFTSANGIYCLANGLRSSGADIRRLGNAKIAVIGPETAEAAEEVGLRVDFMPTRYVAEALAEEFPEPLSGRRVLIPRAKEAREILPELWRRQGATVDVLPVYETVPDSSEAPRLRALLEAGEVDAITFTAASAVRSFATQFAGADLSSVCVACIGPIAAAKARELGLRVDVVSEEHTARGLIDALEQHYAAAGVSDRVLRDAGETASAQ